MKTVLTALALTVSVVACGKKTQEVPLDPTTTPVVAEPAKVESAVTPTSAVIADPSMGTGGTMKEGTGATITSVPSTSTTGTK